MLMATCEAPAAWAAAAIGALAPRNRTVVGLAVQKRRQKAPTPEPPWTGRPGAWCLPPVDGRERGGVWMFTSLGLSHRGRPPIGRKELHAAWRTWVSGPPALWRGCTVPALRGARLTLS